MKQFALIALTICAAGVALASVPGESTAPAPKVDEPIHHAPARPVPMAVMNYETFEATVNHADLAECPKALAREGRFCRVTLRGDALHIFAFSEEFDQPLQAVLEIPLDQISFPQ